MGHDESEEKRSSTRGLSAYNREHRRNWSAHRVLDKYSLIIFSPLDIRFSSRILSRVRTSVSSRSHAAILDTMILMRQ